MSFSTAFNIENKKIVKKTPTSALKVLKWLQHLQEISYMLSGKS